MTSPDALFVLVAWSVCRLDHYFIWHMDWPVFWDL